MGKVDKDIETLVSEGSVMPDGRRADTARAQLEYKNQLKNAGDIYVGTGDYIVNSDGTGNEIYITEGKNIQDALREDINRRSKVILGTGDVYGVGSTALGYTAKASGSYSTALGGGANANAANAVQIGVGTNNVANSLQFRDKTVVNGNGEIAGDYPLGFTGRVSDINNVTWKDAWHNDIQSKNPKLITDWAFRDTSQLPWSTGEIAFVSTYDSSQIGGSPTKTNIVLDGRVYVDLGAHRVYAEGDVVDQAKQADYPTGFTKRQTSVLDDGWPKKHSDLVDGTIVTGWCYGEGGNANIAFVKTYDSTAQTSDLNLVVDGNIYVEEGLRRVYAEGDIVEKAAYALKTSFSNTTFESGYPLAITLKESGTYQFYYEPLAFSCLLYYNINSLGRSSVFVSPQDIVVGGKTQISQNEKFYMQIGSNGDVKWFKENVKIDGLDGFYSVSSSWTDFNPLTSDKKVYYRKID